MPPFGKVLVANRGEIAVRVIRALRELGIRSVAIYSSADRRALHVLMADEAYYVGPAEAARSYLNIERIVEVAKKAKVDAVHPGYGFLAQNAAFVRRLEEEGITFIGPSARIHELVSDKLGIKQFLDKHGIPVIPGALVPLDDVDAAADAAAKIGYPVLLKPRFGGGGIGMRICRDERELREAFEVSRKLAASAFGSGELYMERYYSRARHIEVQILADKHGNVIHLLERECSIQRRFQKLIEEAPSPALDDELRRRVAELAVRVAKLVGYVNAGTVEFLYVPDERRFYFMELNSRIQVEHPVTEMITGVDLVKEQIMIAAGERLSISQDEVEARGHAIEARVYAEDPRTFVPCPGLLEAFIPPSGPGVRVDHGVYPGYEIPPDYDPLIAKVIAWGKDRAEAIARLKRALEEFVVRGVKTNIPLHLAILSHPRFLRGDIYTKFLDEERVEPVEHRQPAIPARPERKVEIRVETASAWKTSSRLIACGL